MIGAAAIVGAAMIVGCGEKSDERPARPEAARPAPTPGASSTTVQTTGSASISGSVTFIGAPKRRESLANLIAGDAVCAQMTAGAAVLDETYVIDANGGVKNVFVYIKDAPQGAYSAPAEPKTLDQKGCVYIPHAVGIQTGQTLEILNSDETTHNVNAQAKINPGFNKSMPRVNMKFEERFNREEIFKIKCDVHGWMGAYIGVFEHPFFSVSAADGSFSIQQLPAGTYTLAAWHERLGETKTTVIVADGEAKTADLSFGG